MKKTLMAAIAVAFAASALVPAAAGPMPKRTDAASVTKISLPPAKPFRFGRVAPKNQSVPPKRTAWVCFTQAGTCYAPFLGGCCCNIWNGWVWVTWCGHT